MGIDMAYPITPYVLQLVGCNVLCFLVLFLVYRRYSLRHTLPSPPGPRGIPILGNMLQVPKNHTWRYFKQLSHEYGPIVKLTMGIDEMVILTDPLDAEELLERRSWNYSSRKPLIYAGKYQSNNMRMVLLPYGKSLRKQRAAFHQMLQPRVIGGYEAMQATEAAKLLHEMSTRPLEWSRNCQRYAASLVFYLSYGKPLADDDRDLTTITEILNNFVRDTYPGAHLVDVLPVLDCLPDMLAPWRVPARARHAVETQFYQRLAANVRERMHGDPHDIECFAARLWEQKEKLSLNIEELSYVAGSAFEAGTDTTTATLLWFFMAMVLFPDAQKKAQQEIDVVVGPDGSLMPGFDHMDQLPYCTALTKELFRWAPAAPGGFPHYSDSDDEYRGYRIKAHTLVIPCIWAMHRNPREFPDPDKFKPERYLGPDTCTALLTEGHYGFGFGRRVCPGKYLASKTIWIAVTRMLWAFDIHATCDENVSVVDVDPQRCTSGMTSRPLDFPFHIVPRSDAHALAINEAWAGQK